MNTLVQTGCLEPLLENSVYVSLSFSVFEVFKWYRGYNKGDVSKVLMITKSMIMTNKTKREVTG